MILYDCHEGQITFYDDSQDEFMLIITKGALQSQMFFAKTASEVQEKFHDALRVNREHVEKGNTVATSQV